MGQAAQNSTNGAVSIEEPFVLNSQTFHILFACSSFYSRFFFPEYVNMLHTQAPYRDTKYYESRKVGKCGEKTLRQ